MAAAVGAGGRRPTGGGAGECAGEQRARQRDPGIRYRRDYPGTPFRIGLRIRVAPGWLTYWQNPGDAGVASDLTLNLPAGVAAKPIEWPTPQRITEGPLVTYGYTGDLLLPLTVVPAANAAPIPIEATATWLVCKQICVPEQGRFRLELPAGDAVPSAQAPLFASADAARPITAPWPARIAPDGRLRVEGAGLGPATVASAWFFPATAGTIDDAAPQRLPIGLATGPRST